MGRPCCAPAWILHWTLILTSGFHFEGTRYKVAYSYTLSQCELIEEEEINQNQWKIVNILVIVFVMRFVY